MRPSIVELSEMTGALTSFPFFLSSVDAISVGSEPCPKLRVSVPRSGSAHAQDAIPFLYIKVSDRRLHLHRKEG